MTIIRPNKQNRKLQNFFIGILGFCLVALVWWGIINYGMIVDLRHDLGVLQKSIQNTELQNAELATVLFNAINLERLEERALELGLKKENNPDYIKTNTEPVISENPLSAL